MVIKIGMILLLVAALFFPSIYADNSAAAAVVKEHSFKDYVLSFGVALVAVSFTYGGYQQTINFGSEVEKPSRNIPRGIFIGIIVIILLYLVVNLAYYKVVGFELMQNRGQGQEIAAILTGKLFGQTGSNIFSALLFLSVLAYVNVLLMSNPLVMFAMSEDGVIPKVFQKKSKRRDVLVVALSVFAATCIIILFFSKKFEDILKFTIFLDCIGMATSAATIFVLRKKTKHLDGTGIYKMKLYPLLPLIFIAAYTFVAISIAIDDYQTALTGIAVLGAFMIIYFATRNLGSKKIV